MNREEKINTIWKISIIALAIIALWLFATEPERRYNTYLECVSEQKSEGICLSLFGKF